MTESVRNADLREMLTVRRSEMRDEVQSRIRQGRTGQRTDARDDIDLSDADIQGDIEFALIQMKSETLNKVDAALRRLDDGSYGDCFECGDEIAEARLRALPFAVRCKDCEEARETAERRERVQAQKRGSSALFYDMQN